MSENRERVLERDGERERKRERSRRGCRERERKVGTRMVLPPHKGTEKVTYVRTKLDIPPLLISSEVRDFEGLVLSLPDFSDLESTCWSSDLSSSRSREVLHNLPAVCIVLIAAGSTAIHPSRYAGFQSIATLEDLTSLARLHTHHLCELRIQRLG